MDTNINTTTGAATNRACHCPSKPHSCPNAKTDMNFSIRGRVAAILCWTKKPWDVSPRQRLELRFEDAAVAGESCEDRLTIGCDIARLVIRGRADHQKAPGNDVGAVVDHGQAGGAVPAFLIGPDQMLAIEGQALDHIAADQAVELRKHEFAVLKRQVDGQCLCRNRIDQKGGDRGW